MNSFLALIDLILVLYTWVLIIYVVMSWLTAFNVINTYNPFVNQIGRFLYKITEPVLRPIRKIVPDIGGIDLSPLILLLLIWFARSLLREYGPRLLN